MKNNVKILVAFIGGVTAVLAVIVLILGCRKKVEKETTEFDAFDNEPTDDYDFLQDDDIFDEDEVFKY